jgi:hypothetical protein
MENIKTNSEVGNLIREQEKDYTAGNPVRVSEYNEYDMYEDLNKIDAYDNSKHISGDKDSKGRDKPFFNIVKAVVNIWYRATDIDRKHIRIFSNKMANYVSSFMATIYLQAWMKKSRFGQFLNNWGRTLAKYGSAVVKFVEKDGELKVMVLDWHKLIVDPVDFYGNPVIEVLDLTPAQLRKRGYDSEVVDKLIETTQAGKRDKRRDLKGIQKDDRDGYIRVYEVHGELPLNYLTDDEDDKDETQQMMIAYSFVGTENDGFTDYFLYRGKEAKSPYMLTHLIEEDGKTLSTGAVKQLFEAQWMVNHSMKAMKDQLDLASKLIFQTADENYVGKNALSAIENGDIMVHAPNAPLTQIANNSHDITSISNMKAEWQSIGNEQVGASDAMRGVQPKSGTAWRQTEAILQENHSLFEVMTENKALSVEDMLREYVLPFIKRKLNNKDEIVAQLDSHDLQKLDKMYIKSKAREELEKKAKAQIKEALLQGEIPGFIDQDMSGMEEELKANLAEFGNERFIIPSELSEKSWKEIFKDLEWEVEVDISGESADLQAHLQTLNTLYVNMLNTGQIKDARKVLEKILEITGAFSPIELATLEPVAPPQAEATAPAEAPAQAV